MDIDACSFQTDFLGSPILFGASKRVHTDNVQVSGGLMRYHSAPSSMLVSLVDEEFFPRDSSPFSQAENSELTSFLFDDSVPSTSLGNSRPTHQTDKVPAGSTKNGVKEGHSQYIGPGGSSLIEDVKRAPLSAILENGLEESLEKFCCAQMPANQQVAQSGHQSTIDSSVHDSFMTRGSNFNRPPQANSGLIRHSSSPADFLSRLVMEENSDHFPGSYMHPTVEGMSNCNPGGKNTSLVSTGLPGTLPSFSTRSFFDGVNNMGIGNASAAGACSMESASVPTGNGLLRQSSSPAGLLSQLCIDEISAAGEIATSSSSGNSSEENTLDRRGGTTFMDNYAVGWDEVRKRSTMQDVAAFGQKKRGRDVGAKTLQGLSVKDSVQRSTTENTDPSNDFSVPATTSPGSSVSMERSMVDAAFCRSRAKRGCATHPRSIAERVRRTKISDGIKKLQELIPNMDKQANIADMLDEAVEYVKLLQHQVQELTENRPKCNGMCQQNGNASL